MSEHLSALALDTLAAELPHEGAVHLSTCAECRTRLEALKARHRQIAGMPEFKARFEAIALPRPAPQVRPRRWAQVMAVALPLAAALAVVVLLSPGEDDVRLKGAPTIALVLGDRPVTKANPGDRLGLRVGGAGHTHGAVFVIDAVGAVERLWPTSDQAAPIPTGANVPIGADFEVTPGSVEIVAIFSDRAQPLDEVRSALKRAVADAVGQGKSPLDLAVPGALLPFARVRLEVGP